MQGPYQRGRRTWIDPLLAGVGVHEWADHGVCDGGLLVAGERRRIPCAMRLNVGLAHIASVDADGGDGSGLSGNAAPGASLKM